MHCAKNWTFRLAANLVAANALVSTALSDVITDWNNLAHDYLIQHTTGFEHVRGKTMVHVAQFDALNAALGGYTPYALTVVAPGASPEAAAVCAAYTVLTNLSRADLRKLNGALSNSLAAVPDGPAKAAGVELGRVAGETILQLRAADNTALPITPPNSQAVGKWRPTPPRFEAGEGANFRYFLPWTMRSQAQFRPPPPPALKSEQYAADLEEVRLLGGKNSTTRTADQSDAATWHAGNDRSYLLPALPQRDLSLLERSRLLALFYMVWFDSGVAFLEAQYAYNLWRPITAIRNAGVDGNDLTQPDATWLPFEETPNHPEYPSGTCSGTAAMIDVLIQFFGDNYPFTASVGHTPKPRTFSRPSAAVEDAITARIAAGAHYRTLCVRGVELGRTIAQNALRNFLRPAPRLTSGAPRTPGEFVVHLSTVPEIHVIEASSDLSSWTPVSTNIVGTTSHTDATAGANLRFYRSVVLRQ